MSFLRHEQIYQSDVVSCLHSGAGLMRLRPGASHRLDESATGYSSASCTPALLASASPDIAMVSEVTGTVNHHSLEAGESSVGEMGNFHLALTQESVLSLKQHEELSRDK
jgi:hypothetical protein